MLHQLDLSGYRVPPHWEVVTKPTFHIPADFPGDLQVTVHTPIGWLHDGTFTAFDKCPEEYLAGNQKPKESYQLRQDDLDPKNFSALLLNIVNAEYRAIVGDNLPAVAYQKALEVYTKYVSDAFFEMNKFGYKSLKSQLINQVEILKQELINTKI